MSNHYHGSKRGILQSAVELTRRSKRASGRSRGKRNTFVKGQKAFYRSAKGIAKVTVCGIHHDSKLEPYYTIQLRDGKEKQTDGKHLTPIQEDVKGSSSKGRQRRVAARIRRVIRRRTIRVKAQKAVKKSRVKVVREVVERIARGAVVLQGSSSLSRARMTVTDYLPSEMRAGERG